MPIVKPRKIGGFPELEPAQQIALDHTKLLICRSFERFGFVPVEALAVEPKEVLLARGSMDRQIYTVARLTGEKNLQTSLERAIELVAQNAGAEFLKTYSNDESQKEFGIETSDSQDVKILKALRGLAMRAQTDMALHFDLTIPLAHFVAKHEETLLFPFRRYQVQKVWREEPRRSGRAPEFYQCDIDVIGKGSLDILTDSEIPSIIWHVFREMKIGKFVIHISNAKILEEYLQHAGIAKSLLPCAKNIIDKMKEVGKYRTADALSAGVSIPAELSREIVNFLAGSERTTAEVIARLGKVSANERFHTGVEELSTVMKDIRMFGVPDESVRVDLTIASDLDYYTGTVYETVLVDHPGIGSICSGGRYDDLAGHYTDQKFPGVGISIDLTVLMGRLFSTGLLKAKRATTASVLVTTCDRLRMADYVGVANELRGQGINVEIYLDDAPIVEQIRYANRKGFELAIVASDQELDRKCVRIRNLVVGGTTESPIDTIANNVAHALGLIPEGGGR